MTDPQWGAVYAETRERLSDLALARAADADRTVPACPDWTVKDAVAHVTGIVTDILDQNLDGVGSDAWTQAQIDARRDKTIEQVVDEWRTRGPEFDAGLDLLGRGAGRPAISDLVTHEMDVRQALDAPGGRDSDAMAIAFDQYREALGNRITEQKRPALRLIAGTDDMVLGDGEPATTLRGDQFELTRAMVGRRSDAQVRALDWDGDATPYLDIMSSYGTRDTDLVE
jgi:uncharacterized protein (TIGR03083 family)